MLKKYFLLISIITFSCLAANADPVIINDLGGLYLNKNVTEIEMRHANKAVQEVQDYTIKEDVKKDVEEIQEKNIVPASSNSEYTFKKGKMDNSQTNYEEVDVRGVNNSKTIYTDDLGRLHFFGKGNIIRE